MRGSLVVGLGILIGNISGFFRVVVTAYLLGTHARADALAVAIGPIDNITNAIINTMLVAFVPLLMVRSAEERAALFERAWRVFPVFLAGAAGLLLLLAPQVIDILGPGLAPAQHAEAVRLLRMIAPAILFGGSSAVLSALLYTERRFLIPALFQACVNGGMVAGAMLLWRVAGEDGFALGYTFGAALHMALTWMATRGLRTETELRVPLRHILLKPAMFLVYAALFSANILVTRAFATHAGSGMAAAFEYCLRCVSVVAAYLIYPVANSLLPEVARLRGVNQPAQALRLIDRAVALMAGASVLACGFGLLVRTPVIALLFQRGNFNADSTVIVSAVFLGFAPAIVGWVLFDLISRCSFALDRPSLPLCCAGIPVLVNIGVMSVLPVRADTLAIGASAGLLAGFAALFTLAHFRRREISEHAVDDANVIVRAN